MRGEVSRISKRYSKPSYKYLKQESKHNIYLVANNLSGYAMSKFSPIQGFKWVDPKELDSNKYSWNIVQI